jgi:hypothetical protein
MSSYNGKVYRKQGGNELVVESGGKITAAGTQAAHIANATGAAGANPTQAEYADLVAKFNAVLVALEGVGITAAS